MKEYIKLIVVISILISCSNQKTTEVKSYYDHDAKLLKEEYSVLSDSPSVREGKYFLYSQFGKLIETRIYQHNQISDTLRRFYESGKVSEETIYRNNQLNGTRILFHENGNIILKEFYSNGDSVGVWESY